jgi:hypothetical protein
MYRIPAFSLFINFVNNNLYSHERFSGAIIYNVFVSNFAY